ncbi:hypothetical protein PG993_003160 [Apiospora rasikravindrae]|uniref:Clr5 domain-containing protein n=1 Tax=Apiospora rasikravindrae TaxID=990691 RepID=A0ABR1TYR6_9PEZI
MSGTRRQSNKQTAFGMLDYEKNLYEDLFALYAQGSHNAAADWEARRDWMFQRADLNCGTLRFVLQTYYKRFLLPEDEPEAHGSREAGVAIQQARLKYGYKLTHSEWKAFVANKGWTIDETVAHLMKGRKIHDDGKTKIASIPAAPSRISPTKKRSLLPVPKKPTTKLGGTLRPITEEDDKLAVIIFQAGRYDLPETYQHLVTDLGVGREANKVSVTALVIERSSTMPMPLCIAAEWQKEATVVLRVLAKMIERKVEFLQKA